MSVTTESINASADGVVSIAEKRSDRRLLAGQREMRFLEACPNCGSPAIEAWSASLRPNDLHHIQTQCRNCKLVFSNPQCTAETLHHYYATEYYEQHWEKALQRDSTFARGAAERHCTEVDRIRRLRTNGRLLEIGAGTGAFLEAARWAGFEPFGVEPSLSAVDYARSVYGLPEVRLGSFEGNEWEPASFDVVYAWHVIEHVQDLDDFLGRIHRVLKPGGILWIGTENYRCSTYFLEKWRHILRGSTPPFITSTEHTFAFTPDTLTEVLRRRGFSVRLHETYQPSWSEKRSVMHFRSFAGLAYFALQHAANTLFRTGPLMRVAAECVDA